MFHTKLQLVLANDSGNALKNRISNGYHDSHNGCHHVIKDESTCLLDVPHKNSDKFAKKIKMAAIAILVLIVCVGALHPSHKYISHAGTFPSS